MAGYALPAEVEERQVLASCMAGEDAGFDLLYRRYAPALIQFCEHRLGNVGDAEDAAHETILKAHRAMPRFREGARLWPWLATIAANVCTDMQRSRERLSPPPDEVDWLAPEVDEDVSRRLRASIVDAALDELPERFRTPLFLREFMGWSYEDIARFSNKSIGSVRTTLMRARRAFQARVEDVARRRGQWPLPAAVVGGWRRLRSTVRSWRDGVARAGNDGAAALWRAEGFLTTLAPGAQMAVVAMVAAGTMAAGPTGMVAETPVRMAPVVAVSDAPSTSGVAAVLAPGAPAAAAPVAPASQPQARSVITVNHAAPAVAPRSPTEGVTEVQEDENGDVDLYSVAGVGDVGNSAHADVVNCSSTKLSHQLGCEAWRAVRPGSH